MDVKRLDFALIPGGPLFSQVIRASQSITDEYYYNSNVIDADKYPPHVSLHICTIRVDLLPSLEEEISSIWAESEVSTLKPVDVSPASGGYIMLYLERSEALVSLHERVIEAAATARAGVDSSKYGNDYVLSDFSPHLSLAKVEADDRRDATAIAKEVLADMPISPVTSFDLCDIGPRNERWDVLTSLRPRHNT
jgi:hypothetical protein